MSYLIGGLFISYAAGVTSLIYSLLRSIPLLRGRGTPRLQADGPRLNRPPPTLDVVIPVKDEERHVAGCIEAVLAQDHPPAQVVVVNDRSTDGTAQAVQVVADQHSLVHRVDIKELPQGCYGKPHALHQIAGKLKSEYVAFVDSDLILDRSCLGTLVGHLAANRLDWVAVMGAPQVSRFWERLVVPLFGAVIFAWYDPRKISDPRWPNALGSALMVCRREAYEAIGGHGAVIRSYDEDSELVRIAKRAGQRISFLLTPELFEQRHYGGLAATIRGMTRTFVGAIKTVPRLLFTAGALSFVSLAPLIFAVLLGIAAGAGWPVLWKPLWWTAVGAHLLASTALAALVYQTAGLARRLALLHPIGCVILIHVCGRAVLHKLRGQAIAWRGTNYKASG